MIVMFPPIHFKIFCFSKIIHLVSKTRKEPWKQLNDCSLQLQ